MELALIESDGFDQWRKGRMICDGKEPGKIISIGLTEKIGRD